MTAAARVLAGLMRRPWPVRGLLALALLEVLALLAALPAGLPATR